MFVFLPLANRPPSFASADMAVPFLLVIFLVGALADVMETDLSQCDVESPSFLQLKHQGQQAAQDTLQLLVTSANLPNPGVVYKCNVTQNPDFRQDCVDLTTGRIPDGVGFTYVWEVEVLPEPENGFLVMSRPFDTLGSIVHCPEVGSCSALLPPGDYKGGAAFSQSASFSPQFLRSLGNTMPPASPNTWPKTQWLTSVHTTR